MKTSLRLLAAGGSFCFLLFAGCEGGSTAAPPVNAALLGAGARVHATEPQLVEGRRLFLSRCITCHALPSIAEHSAAEWPQLVREMASRADLREPQRDAVTAYILAVRSR